MTATIERDSIKTDNELWGNGFLDESQPGSTWIVLVKSNTGKTSYVAHVYTNRQAAEDYIHAKCEDKDWPLHRYAIQVWQAEDAYEPDEDEAPEDAYDDTYEKEQS